MSINSLMRNRLVEKPRIYTLRRSLEMRWKLNFGSVRFATLLEARLDEIFSTLNVLQSVEPVTSPLQVLWPSHESFEDFNFFCAPEDEEERPAASSWFVWWPHKRHGARSHVEVAKKRMNFSDEIKTLIIRRGREWVSRKFDQRTSPESSYGMRANFHFSETHEISFGLRKFMTASLIAVCRAKTISSRN